MHRGEALVRVQQAPPLGQLPQPSYKRGGRAREPHGEWVQLDWKPEGVRSEDGWGTSPCREPRGREKGTWVPFTTSSDK